MTKSTAPKVGPLFPETKKVLAAFNNATDKLQHEKETLEMELDTITTKIAEVMATVEGVELAKRIDLNIEIKQLKDKSDVIQKMLEENDAAVSNCYLKHAKLLIDARRSESKLRSQYNLEEIAKKHINAMYAELHSIGKEFKSQHSEVVGGLAEIYTHPIVKHHHPCYSTMYDYSNYALKIWTTEKNLVTRYDIDAAASGGELKCL